MESTGSSGQMRRARRRECSVGGEVYGVAAQSQEQAGRSREVNRAAKALLANQKTKTENAEEERGGEREREREREKA